MGLLQRRFSLFAGRSDRHSREGLVCRANRQRRNGAGAELRADGFQRELLQLRGALLADGHGGLCFKQIRRADANFFFAGGRGKFSFGFSANVVCEWGRGVLGRGKERSGGGKKGGGNKKK